MSLGKSSRWCCSSARKQRKKPMRSLSPPKTNSTSRSFSWSKLKRRTSGKSTNANNAKSKFARCNFLYTFLSSFYVDFISVSSKFIRIYRPLTLFEIKFWRLSPTRLDLDPWV
ncbi:unnamed protein product [Sphenostylis stenocarpa]|uniref:Uncharacterized protein n=1 Tax=Sphenostylis stenocarpa TaxID=92480 RepID=A0AA86S6W4_9FABA|nr:unnamed protein product [Sphenostylis stenocarpa]